MIPLRSLRALAHREALHVVRRPARVVAGLATPVMLWLVLASGFGDAVQIGGAKAGAYLAPGVVLLMAAFGTMFAAIGYIQDRERGLTDAWRLSGAPAWAVCAAKVLAASGVLVVQATVFAAGAAVIGSIEPPRVLDAISAVGAVFAAGVLTTSLGLVIAARSSSIASFHAIANVVLPAMWLVSGAVFDVRTGAAWIGAVAAANPLAWVHACLRAGLLDEQVTPLVWVGTVGGAGIAFAAAAWSVSTDRRGVRDG